MKRKHGKLSVMQMFSKDKRITEHNITTKGYYSHETDICKIHSYILNSFIKDRDKIPEWEKEIEDFTNTIRTTPLTVIDRNEIKRNRQIIREKIDNAVSKNKQNEYLSKVKDILTLYKDLVNKRSGTISFGTQRRVLASS